jgi:hypothetical protein
MEGSPAPPQTPESDDSEAQEIKRGIWMGILTAAALVALVILASLAFSSGGYFVDATGNFRIDRVCAKSLECDPDITMDGCRVRYQVLQNRGTLNKAKAWERSVIVQCLQERDMETACQDILECIIRKSRRGGAN